MQQRWLASSEKGVERDGGSVAESGTGGKCSPLTVLDQFCSKIFYTFFFFFFICGAAPVGSAERRNQERKYA
jgi:hypothetical protein